MAGLLQQGIGDTIRVSLTPEPNGDRTKEVLVAQEILQTMGLRSFAPMVAACPGCGRTTSTFFQQLAGEVQEFVRAKMPEWKLHYDGAENMTLAVMGCIVNGPGESKHANIGISLPGMRIAGGLIVAFLGFQMLFPNPISDKEAMTKAAGEKYDIAFTPLAMPGLSG